MAEIRMPQLGESVTEGTITRWFKGVGDRVETDEILFEVSTDKVDSEVPSPEAGYIAEIRVPEGETVDVGAVLVVLSDAAPGGGGEVPMAPPAAPAAPPAPAPVPAATAPAAPPAPAPVPAVAPPVAPAADANLLLSPVVRRLIADNQLDPGRLTGTGVGGRITREDVLAAIDARAAGPVAPAATAPVATPAPAAPAVPAAPAAPPAPSAAAEPAGASTGVARVGDTVEKLNNMRIRTGEHMVMSLATSPHAITAIDVDYEGVERARKPVRDAFKVEEGFALTYLPFAARAVVDALAEFPHMNASLGNGELIVHHFVNLSIAVDLNYQGLLAPVIPSADSKRLRAIAREINDLADRARSKRLSPDELSGGTFTISNSGSYGTLLVAPIINQPQVAILSTDGVKRRPVVVELPDGSESIAIHSVGNLTLSWDHRAFDGAYAAAFVARVKEIIETRDWSAEL